jgi:lysophospholipase L1-like esterase
MARFSKVFKGLAVLAMAATSTALDMRLMPLGASITFGVGSSDGNGYRAKLRDQIVGAGHNVDMVGTQTGGSMEDNQNEGYPGLRIEEVQGKAEQNVPSFLPNVYTINVGTNDASQNFDVDNAGGRMNDLLNYLWTATPDATVILSTLIINLDSGTDARAQHINGQFSDLAGRLADEGRRIVLVDMHGADGPQSNEMSDNTHPNDTGFQKMADIFFRGIQQATDAGFIV